MEDSNTVAIVEALNRLAKSQERLVEIAEEDMKMRQENHTLVSEQMKQREQALGMINKLNIDPEALNQSMKQVSEMMGSYSEERDEFKKKLGKK